MSHGSTLSAEIAVTLRTEILSKRYREGDRLPSERELATRFSASRGAVREALSQLEQLRIISVQPGGARVQPIELASIAILGPLLGLQEVPAPELVDQFLQTFGALASLTAREAVAMADQQQLLEFQGMIADLRQYSGDPETFHVKWVALLEAMAEVADNLVVRLIGNDLKAQFVGQVFKLSLKPTIRESSVKTILKSLAQACRDADKDQAHAAVTLYFDELRLAMVHALESRLAS